MFNFIIKKKKVNSKIQNKIQYRKIKREMFKGLEQ